MSSPHWVTVTDSRFAWEREAIQFVRERFPMREPFRAWSNLEFVAEDGSVNEVDLLALTPVGFFLIEIKSTPGLLRGDAGTWVWETPDGRVISVDNPLFSADLKSKKLKGVLERQNASRTGRRQGRRIPFLEPLVFCSAPELSLRLTGRARTGVFLRDRDRQPERAGRPGIMAAILRREGEGIDSRVRSQVNRPIATLVSQAVEQAGIRRRMRKVSDYVLDEVINEGPGYQDWVGRHTQLPDVNRRIRLYLVRSAAAEEERLTIERAAQREFQLLENLQHPNILRVFGYTRHELGPALVFEHLPDAVRLDHFLVERHSKLGIDLRLDLVRQIAEVVRFAHEKKIIHRALSPRSILISRPESKRPEVKILDWQAGFRRTSTSVGLSREVTPTSHAERLVDDSTTAYMAPEALAHIARDGEELDVFSLGAIAFLILSGVPPAANGLELSEKLRETKGLQISSVLNGAGAALQDLIQYSTHPESTSRVCSATDFLDHLELVVDELTEPDQHVVEDPLRAQKGDSLPGGFRVRKRLGQGACSVALLVEREGEEFVLKIAAKPEFDSRVQAEGEVLRQLHHQHIVRYCETLAIGDRTAILMRQAGNETLGQRLRAEGFLKVDLLQRFGEDLLDVIRYLEEQGIAHRDIKPDNIGVGPVGRSETLHLTLFDFSLSRTPREDVRAGTRGYLDPLLTVRKQWDSHGDRYSAAATLYEAATGTLPVWGDGNSDPAHLDCEITVESERFDASLRERLTDFFVRAFRRDVTKRFDNAEQMLRAWRRCFEGLGKAAGTRRGRPAELPEEAIPEALLVDVGLETQIPELGLSARATNALDRANLLTVGDLLRHPLLEIQRMRGVGHKTRREIVEVVKRLRARLGDRESMVEVPPPEPDAPPSRLSVDLLAQRVQIVHAKAASSTLPALLALLDLDPEREQAWPTQTEVAHKVGVTRARVSQIVGEARKRWSRDPALTAVRAQMAEFLESAGGAMTRGELTEALLSARGSVQEEPWRSRLSRAVLRAAVEVEQGLKAPRFVVRRTDGLTLLALTPELADFALRLGEVADAIAAEDPLLPPTRAVEKLGQIKAPGDPPVEARLLRLAAAASRGAAVSSRQELYPRRMDPLRALKLSHGALLGLSKGLDPDQILERVRSRYPEAEPLPGRPGLDDLLEEAGFDLRWDPGQGLYVSRSAQPTSVSSAGSLSRQSTVSGHLTVRESDPEYASARQFEERLQRALKERSFLVLTVPPAHYQVARREISHRFSIQVTDFEELFLDALRKATEEARVDWDLVLQTDATPDRGDWNKLLLLVERAMPQVERRLLAAKQPSLVIYAGLLARYGQMELLERLREQSGRPGGPPGVWLLVPGERQALLEGKAIPVISPGQRTRIPESWLENRHRSNGKKTLAHD